MKAWISFSAVIVLLVLGFGLAPGMGLSAGADTIEYTLSNEDAREYRYWAQINRIREREVALRERSRTAPRLSAAMTPRRYDYEGYAHLRPAFLLYAANEGIAHARKALADQSEEVIDRQAYENVGMALQYYPLIATEPEHYQEIIDTLRDRSTDPVLRRFIAEQLGAEPHHHALLQIYLREHLRRAPEDSIRLLRRLSQDPLELHAIQRAAMRGLFNFMYLAQQFQIKQDELLMPFLEAQGVEATPEALVSHPQAPKLPETAELILELQETMQHFVDICIAHLRPEANRPEETRALALASLRRMRSEMPFNATEQIDEVLAREHE